MQPYALMFHHFVGGRHPAGQGALSATTFRSLLDAEPNLLSARAWLHDAMHDDLSLDARCITFDDGLRCQIDIALPILEERNLTAMWFVHSAAINGEGDHLELYRHYRMTAFEHVDAFYDAFEMTARECGHDLLLRTELDLVDTRQHLAAFPFYTDADRRFRYLRDRVLGPDRYHATMQHMLDAWHVDRNALTSQLWMSRDDVRRLHDAGHVIGLHSHDHPTDLKALSKHDQQQQYLQNAACLAACTGEQPIVAAHPCNSYNDETLGILTELGVRIAFRSNVAMTDGSYLEWPREDPANLLRARSTHAGAMA
ncbi:MAG: polysaccharide deacetylase family protein [Planctomycetota bacterium]